MSQSFLELFSKAVCFPVSNAMADEAGDWCAEAFGAPMIWFVEEGHPLEIVETRWMKARGQDTSYFYFFSETDAALFRLTWTEEA